LYRQRLAGKSLGLLPVLRELRRRSGSGWSRASKNAALRWGRRCARGSGSN